MNKSMKQIADELGVDKQQVYRFIVRNNIREAVQNGQLKLFDETAQIKILSYFVKKSTESKITSAPHRTTSADAHQQPAQEAPHKVNQISESDTVETAGFSRFSSRDNTSNQVIEPHQSVLIESLRKQIETLENDKAWLLEQCKIKDKQIDTWAQAAAAFNKKSEPKLIEENTNGQKSKKPFWLRIFRRK